MQVWESGRPEDCGGAPGCCPLGQDTGPWNRLPGPQGGGTNWGCSCRAHLERVPWEPRAPASPGPWHFPETVQPGTVCSAGRGGAGHVLWPGCPAVQCQVVGAVRTQPCGFVPRLGAEEGAPDPVTVDKAFPSPRSPASLAARAAACQRPPWLGGVRVDRTRQNWCDGATLSWSRGTCSLLPTPACGRLGAGAR